MIKPVVDVKNIQKLYGKKGENQSHALKGVSFSIQEGSLSELWDLLVLVKRHY